MGTYTFYINQAYPSGLHNYSYSSSPTYAGRYGYNATGYWNTKPDGSGVSVNEATSFANGGDLAYTFGYDIGSAAKQIDVYPMWTPWTHTVKYNLSGGSGSFANQTKTYGAIMYVPSAVPELEGYTFSHWSCSNGHNYDPGEAYGSDQNGGTVTMTAVWERASNCFIKVNGSYVPGMMYVKSGGTYKTGSVDVKEGNAWK
jgi:hypothetical protein